MFDSAQTVIASNRRIIFVFTAITVFLLCFVTAGLCQEVLNLSIPCSSLGLIEGERVGAFEVKITGGEIVSFPNVPRGWGLFIDNEPNQKTRIGGNAIVGTAFLEPGFFDDFISIMTHHPDRESLKIKITIGTMTNITLKERWFDLDKNDLVLKKVK
ncbi:MAG: hypothetical protein ABSH41_08625 [Syntrophobacteraceae bacterium]|jgi:hypothetical protein